MCEGVGELIVTAAH